MNIEDHKIGNTYSMLNRGGSASGQWKIVYYPLPGTWEGQEGNKKWISFEEPRALIEQPIKNGTDFREVPLRYLINSNKNMKPETRNNN